MILAAHPWKDNSALIADAAALGYIGDRVLDPTFGKGNWWKQHQPVELVGHDITTTGVDFRALPDIGPFDTVAFDPPYVPVGGRTTTTIDDFNQRYGLVEVPHTNEELRELIRDGMAEFRHVLTKNGTLLVKCMSYVTGGRWRPMPRWVAQDAERLGYVQIDELVHLRRPGPQPNHPVQRTARRNYSMLLVFRWPS